MAQGTTKGVPIDTDPLLAADSDLLVASQKATKAYADTKQTALGFTPENVANKENTTLDTSTTKYPTNNLVKTYADAKVTDAIVNGVTTIAPSQNAVFDALALKQNNLYRIIDTNQYNVTGSTGETIAVSKLIPAGTFAVGDVFEVTYFNRRINAAIGALTPRTSINTSASLSGVSRMAVGAVMSTGNTWQRMLRAYSIKSATETVMVNNSIQLTTDLQQTSAGTSIVNINWAVDQYLIFSHQNSNSADITAVEGITIRKL